MRGQLGEPSSCCGREPACVRCRRCQQHCTCDEEGARLQEERENRRVVARYEWWGRQREVITTQPAPPDDRIPSWGEPYRAQCGMVSLGHHRGTHPTLALTAREGGWEIDVYLTDYEDGYITHPTVQIASGSASSLEDAQVRCGEALREILSRDLEDTN